MFGSSVRALPTPVKVHKRICAGPAHIPWCRISSLGVPQMVTPVRYVSTYLGMVVP